MKKSYYNYIIKKESKRLEVSGMDTYSMAKILLSTGGVPFPSGDYTEVMRILLGGYWDWTECTVIQAQQCANLGFVAMGINKERVLLITGEEERKNISADQADICDDYANTTNGLTLDDRIGMQFFVYAKLKLPQISLEHIEWMIRSNCSCM